MPQDYEIYRYPTYGTCERCGGPFEEVYINSVTFRDISYLIRVGTRCASDECRKLFNATGRKNIDEAEKIVRDLVDKKIDRPEALRLLSEKVSRSEFLEMKDEIMMRIVDNEIMAEIKRVTSGGPDSDRPIGIPSWR